MRHLRDAGLLRGARCAHSQCHALANDFKLDIAVNNANPKCRCLANCVCFTFSQRGSVRDWFRDIDAQCIYCGHRVAHKHCLPVSVI